jgi:hypothetical protein
MQTNVKLSKREGGRATLYVPMNAVRDGRIPPLHPGSAITLNGVQIRIRRAGKTVIHKQGFLRTPVRAYQVEIVRGVAR